MKPLQPTGHKESDYERPLRRFVCGRTEAPCAEGPDERGGCPLDPPCRPRLGARARLARATLLAAGGTLLAAAVLLLGPWRLRAVSPGPLAAPHQAIEGAGPGEPNCAACHVAASRGPGAWLGAALAGAEPLADVDRCLDCHFTGPARDSAALTHSIPSDVLAGATAEVASPGGPAGLAVLLGPPAADPEGRHACATCHRDHRGRERPLAALADESCQVCHARRFDGLGRGHPEFRPVARPDAGILFDHARHQDAAHFGDQPFECQRCHAPEREGRAMDLRSFEAACRGCHRQGSEDHHGELIGEAGLSLLLLPEMEMPEDAVWPVEAAWGDDVMPPLMRLLLLGDDAALEPLERIALEADGIPYDWLPGEDEPLLAFAAAVRRLVADLAAEGPSRLRERIARALDADPGAPQVARLADQLSGARFPAAVWQARWLPGLDAEGGGASAPSGPPPDWSAAIPASGWRIDPRTGELAYDATGHADPLFRALIEALAVEDPAADAHDDLRAIERRRLTAELFAERGGALQAACLRCHAIRSGAAVDDAWHALGRGAGSTGFRRFDHRPHTAMLRDPQDCARCHELASGAAGEPAASRGFAPHRRELCASCHSASRAGDACLLCHDYHFVRP